MLKKHFFVVSHLSISLFEKKDYSFIFLDEFIRLNFLKKSKKYNHDKIDGKDNYKSIIKESTYLEEVHCFLINKMTFELNKFHETKHDKFTWELFFGVELHFYIYRLYSLFKKFKENFDNEKLEFYLLSKNSFYTPLSFSELRLYSAQDHFTEMMFSIYIQDFLKLETNNKIDFEIEFRGFNEEKINYFKYLLRNIIFKISKALNIKVIFLMCGVYFGRLLKYKLFLKLGFNEYFMDTFTFKKKSKVDYAARYEIFEHKETLPDDFHEFLLKASNYLFPSLFIENFLENEQRANQKLEKFKNLKFFVSENWISNSENNFLKTLCKLKGVKSITLEHNSIFRIYSNPLTKYFINYSDYFISLGWEGNETKIISGGLRNKFSFEKSHKPILDILFVQGPVENEKYICSGIYGYAGENGLYRTVRFNSLFFNNLNSEILNKISVRKYPSRESSNFIEKSDYYKAPIRGVKFLDDKTNIKKLLKKSRLVIIDYLPSTTFIESIFSNIPTILFFDKKSYELNQENEYFFNELIKVGIVQTDPITASCHVEKIHLNPEKWWYSELVQKAINKFKSENFGSEQELLNALQEFNY